MHWGCAKSPIPFIDFEIDAGTKARFDRPVALSLNRSSFVNGRSGQLNVVEINDRGAVVDDDILFQLDVGDDDFGIPEELVILLKGKTARRQSRRFRVSFTSHEQHSKVIGKNAAVSVADIGHYQGDDALEITSDNATYIYHRNGSGFASMIDSDGRDWISYRHSSEDHGSRGPYRGVPNLWNAGFHPGNTEGKRNTTVLGSGPVRVRLLSQTADGEWKCIWDIYQRHATMTLLERGSEPYWFLYEGTPGGEFDLEDYWVLSDGRRLSVEPYGQHNIWQDTLPMPKWVYFGDSTKSRVLYLIHHTAGNEEDQFWHFGEGSMTVFGFGRGDYGTPEWQQLKKTPGRFSIGFAPVADYESAKTVIEDILTPLTIRRL